MGLRIILVLLLLGAGLVLAKLVFFNAPPATADNAPPKTMVVVAASPILTGSLVKAQELQFATLPDHVDADSVFVRPMAPNPADQPAADKKALEEVTGAVARKQFQAGEPLFRGTVVKPGESGFLAAVLSPGERAISIGVTAVSGAAGLIYPGDRVDVILTQNLTSNDVSLTHKSVAETIAQDVRVLAIDQQLQAKAAPTGPEGKLAQTVTLEVDPQQVEKIVVATKLGDLSLTIRSLQTAAQPVEKATGNGGPTWAEDVSPALKTVSITPKPLTSSRPVTVYHGANKLDAAAQ
ncbi:MAG TPA: Flp pilus assembly protein CpaB [Aliidongia sp.]|nr:Flp pilus assembly protein CpaB [Aliidongia sp.]